MSAGTRRPEDLPSSQFDLISDRVWINVKTGNYYEVETMNGVDCTNARDGDRVVIYHPLGESDLCCVREYNEFMVKFIPVVT